MMTMNRPLTALALSLALLVPAGAANAADRVPVTAQEQLALDIYRDIIAIRTARGQARTPEMVAYLVSRLKAAGFADADIMVSDYDSTGEPVQGLIVRFAAAKPDGRKPIVMLGHMDVVDALGAPALHPDREGRLFLRPRHDRQQIRHHQPRPRLHPAETGRLEPAPRSLPRVLG
jgi:hypothetical protein